MPKPHFAIVGASAAGISAALAMRTSGFEGIITLLDKDPRIPYERPPLSKKFDDMAVLKPIVAESTFVDNDIDLGLGETVTAMDPATGTVCTDERTIRADRVLLATGLSAITIDVPGAALDGVMTLRDADDAFELSQRLAKGGRLTVLGGGFIGLELAAVASTLGMDVTVVELSATPLGALNPTVGGLLRERHEEMGVRFRCGVAVTSFEGDGAVRRVVLADGSRIDADVVVVGIGARPRYVPTGENGISLDSGIVVDHHGVTSNPSVFAAGDIANRPHRSTGRRGRIEHWDVALRHGAAVGASMAGVPTEDVEIPYAWSDQYDNTLQMYGRPTAGDRFVLRSDATPSTFIAFWIRSGSISSAIAYGMPRDVRVAKALIEQSTPVSEAELADSANSLRDIMKGARKMKEVHGGDSE
ncbi:NAD(P)/FAD-dependent oxidoreductase [Rhodococcus sp. MEB064]|uniref:NAD(P)/FAD-dependent oxidoreductase n=1 Tax=Rhodococcus sp. MEB064 TaxID=1587522 RepID=UPI0005ACE565|nr:FAD-dependent oxidoreductase [Rhodococcus sp. MEB064]KIQ18457.1 hypothetical protein RU01_07760 [Rhodococcus sp. MEB064]